MGLSCDWVLIRRKFLPTNMKTHLPYYLTRKASTSGLAIAVVLLLLSCPLIEAAKISLINQTLHNGSFEFGSGNTSIVDWKIGFGGEGMQRLENSTSHGSWSLVIGEDTGGNNLGASSNTGHRIMSGDTFDLSFDWLPKFNWIIGDEIVWRLFTTSDDTLTGVVDVIASGTVSGFANGVGYQSESLLDIGTVGVANEGRDLWFQLVRGSSSLDHFARVDNVMLIANSTPQPIYDDLDESQLRVYFPGENDALDYSATTIPNDGIWQAGEQYGDGLIGQSCFDFNGFSGAIELAHTLEGDFTLSFWLNTASTGPSGSHWESGNGLIDATVAGVANDLGVSLVGARVAFGCGNPDTTIFSASTVNDGLWHHIVAQRHNLSGMILLFIDGVLENSSSGPSGVRDSSAVLRLGSLLNGSGYVNARVDDIRIFDVLLNEEAVSKIYSTVGDYDQDGDSDHEELIAATGWLDADESNRLQSMVVDPALSSVSVRLNGKPSRSYNLQRSTSLADNSWVDTGDSHSTNYHGEIELTDINPPAGRGFYRVAVSGRGAALEKQPNIVVIVVDDMGWNDLSANPQRDTSYYTYGANEIYTPHMDRIAQQGVVFTDAYVSSPVCSPSRAGWNTGRHQNNWDTNGGWTPGIVGVQTLPEMLKSVGYTTGRVGKNDYGTNLRSPDYFGARSYPANHGYDYFMGFSAHAHDFWFHIDGGNNVNGHSAHAGPFQFHDAHADPAIIPQRTALTGTDDPNNLDDDVDEYYITDLLTDSAIGYIERATQTSKPFYLTVSYNSVHNMTPQVPGKYLTSEANRLGWVTTPGEAEHYDPATNTTTNPADFHAFYDYWTTVHNIGAAEMRQYYLANLRCLDSNIGRLLDTLNSAGIADDTLVIFFSDNGGPPETGANNGPLAGSKYNVFEGGIRVPFIVSWPAKLPQGEVYNHITSTLDIVPTCLEVAQVNDRPTNLDGVSLMEPMKTGAPTVASLNAPTIDDRTLFWRWQYSNWAVRKGKWKLVKSAIGRSTDGRIFTNEVYFDNAIVGKKSLFDLSESPREVLANDRVDSESAVANELEELYTDWVNSLNP